MPSILATAFLGIAAANALHWRGRSGEQFLYTPKPGWLRFVFVFWTIAACVLAVLHLVEVIPRAVFPVVAVGLSVGQMLHSIARRQQHRAVKKSTPPQPRGAAPGVSIAVGETAAREISRNGTRTFASASRVWLGRDAKP